MSGAEARGLAPSELGAAIVLCVQNSRKLFGLFVATSLSYVHVLRWSVSLCRAGSVTERKLSCRIRKDDPRKARHSTQGGSEAA